MSQRMWNSDYGPLRGFYRDGDRAWIFGVCAGIADRFNFRLGTVRLIFFASFLLFSWLTALTYIAATLLIREKPLIYSGRETEFEFWRRNDRDRWSRL